MYLKRAKTPKTWPIKRKGTKYIVVPTHDLNKGVPLMLMLRDYLNIGSTTREVRKAMIAGQVEVNGKEIKNKNYGLSLNDTVTLKSGENYRLTYSETKRFILEKINASEAKEKVAKVVGKKILKGKKVQISLSDGRTMIVKTDVKIGNSVLVDLKNNDMKKEIPLEKGSEIIVVSGKHIGKKGKVEEISQGVGRVTFAHKKIGLKLNNIMAIK